MTEITPFIAIALGLLSLIVTLPRSKKDNEVLRQTGEKAEGIIFRSDGIQGQRGISRPEIQVRFVTQSKDWITGPINQDFQLTYFGQYKEGEKVEVYYDRMNPKEFYVATKQNSWLGKLIFVVIAFLMMGWGLLNLPL